MESNSKNWDSLATFLDQFGIIVENENLDKLKEGDQIAIDKLFRRIERYVMILTDAEFLKFENLEQIDFGEEEPEQPVANQVPVEYNVAL